MHRSALCVVLTLPPFNKHPQPPCLCASQRVGRRRCLWHTLFHSDPSSRWRAVSQGIVRDPVFFSLHHSTYAGNANGTSLPAAASLVIQLSSYQLHACMSYVICHVMYACHVSFAVTRVGSISCSTCHVVCMQYAAWRHGAMVMELYFLLRVLFVSPDIYIVLCAYMNHECHNMSWCRSTCYMLHVGCRVTARKNRLL